MNIFVLIVAICTCFWHNQLSNEYATGDRFFVSSSAVTALAKTKTGKLLIATNDGKVLTYDIKRKTSHTAEPIPGGNDAKIAIREIAVYADILFVLTRTGDIHLYEIGADDQDNSIKYRSKADLGDTHAAQIASGAEGIYVLTDKNDLILLTQQQSAKTVSIKPLITDSVLREAIGVGVKEELYLKIIATNTGSVLFSTYAGTYAVYNIVQRKLVRTGRVDKQLGSPLSVVPLGTKLLVLFYMKYMIVDSDGKCTVYVTDKDYRSAHYSSNLNVAVLSFLDSALIFHSDRTVAISELRLPAVVTSLTDSGGDIIVGLSSHDSRDFYHGGSIIKVSRKK